MGRASEGAGNAPTQLRPVARRSGDLGFATSPLLPPTAQAKGGSNDDPGSNT